MKLAFDCVFYYVRDLETASRFYSDVLGLTLLTNDAIARYDLDGVLFELIPAPEGTELSGRGNARLCLKVKDLAQTQADLRAKGVTVGQIHEVPGGRLASFPDPDGNELVLWQYA
jgi:catechol 2,3-dioxygenase-like lactoylglutathione lyase family enzyme